MLSKHAVSIHSLTQALSTKREHPWGVGRHTLVHAAIYLQLAWFSSELVLASTAVALAPRIMGKQNALPCRPGYLKPSHALSQLAYGMLQG